MRPDTLEKYTGVIRTAQSQDWFRGKKVISLFQIDVALIAWLKETGRIVRHAHGVYKATNSFRAENPEHIAEMFGNIRKHKARKAHIETALQLATVEQLKNELEKR